MDGLRERSPQPKTSPQTKVGDREERLISELRKDRKIEVRRIQNELYRRYERPIPGERVQMNTSKIGTGLFQYTAVDDYTRYRVLRLGANALVFLDAVDRVSVIRATSDAGFPYNIELGRSGYEAQALHGRADNFDLGGA